MTQEIASLEAIFEFRKAIQHLNADYPFSAAFGPADTRKNCTESASRLYYKLLSHQSDDHALEFRTLCEIAIHSDGSSDLAKVKQLVQVFRPNKDNLLYATDFTRSIDNIYRELKTLAAGIRSASASEFVFMCFDPAPPTQRSSHVSYLVEVDRMYESLLNFGFYLFAMVGSLFFLEARNAMSFALAIAIIAVSFSCIIGSALSSVFEGILMVLFRRPYGELSPLPLSSGPFCSA